MPPKKSSKKAGLKMKTKKVVEEKKDDEEKKVPGDDYVEPFYGLIKVQVTENPPSISPPVPLCRNPALVAAAVQLALVRAGGEGRPLRHLHAFELAGARDQGEDRGAARAH